MGVRLRMLWPLFILTALPLQPAAAVEGDDEAQAEAEAEPAETAAQPKRKDMHLRMIPGPAAAAGLPALLAMGAAYTALRRRRRPPS